MSETKAFSGKIQLIFTGDENDIENKCKELCEFFKYKFEDWHESYKDCLLDTNESKFLIIGNSIYEILSIKDLTYDSFCNIVKIESNVYEFTASFYDGGTCLSEMIEDSINKFNERK